MSPKSFCRRTLLLLLISAPLVTSRQEDVTFAAHDGLFIEGTLHLPDNGDNSWSAAVVLIHGSGPQSRHGYMTGQPNLAFPFTLALFDEIAQAFTDHGIAVLTYDKRSCGTFNQCSTDNNYPFPAANITVHDFLLDAVAAIAYLEEDRNATTIVPVGHSQGGQYIPLLMSEEFTRGSSSVRNGIMLAGPFRPIDEILQYQLDFTLELLEDLGVNVTDDEALDTIPSVRSLADFVQAVHEIRRGTSNASAGGAPASFYKSWFDLTDESQRAASHMNETSLLIVNGDADWNVPPEEALAWERHILSSNNTSSVPTVLILPCVTHAMNCLSESNPAKVNPAEHLSPHVDARVTEALVDFVLEVADNCNSTTTTATVGCSSSNRPNSSTVAHRQSTAIAVWVAVAIIIATAIL